jgi:ABC-type polysaccharide/polyol phosphate export permease
MRMDVDVPVGSSHERKLVSNADQRLALALDDLATGFRSAHIWAMLGWQEIRQRYRRSALGPFWLTISTAVLIMGMGPLYGRLFGQELSVYFPYIAVSFVVWQLVSSIVNESTQVFIAAEPFIKQIRLPFTVHVLRMLCRNAIVFAHNVVIVVIIMAIFLESWSWSILLSFVGILAILVNGVWIAMLLGALCARFRDIPQIVTSIVQITFFLTPVLWKADSLGRHRWAAEINPLYHFMEVVRAPLLGELPSARSWMAVGLVTIVGFLVMIPFFSRFRGRIAYWV